jgi:hypothetical protein
MFHWLLQCQTDCTNTWLRLLENRRKFFFSKELSKLWNKVKSYIPWGEGQCVPSKTLMIDDIPYKALCNPPHIVVFLDPYEATNNQDDILAQYCYPELNIMFGDKFYFLFWGIICE